MSLTAPSRSPRKRPKSATLSSPVPASPFCFRELPVELRTEVLRHLFPSTSVAVKFAEHHRISTCCSVLKVNKQLHQEAKSLFLKHATFYLTTLDLDTRERTSTWTIVAMRHLSLTDVAYQIPSRFYRHSTRRDPLSGITIALGMGVTFGMSLNTLTYDGVFGTTEIDSKGTTNQSSPSSYTNKR